MQPDAFVQCRVTNRATLVHQHGQLDNFASIIYICLLSALAELLDKLSFVNFTGFGKAHQFFNNCTDPTRKRNHKSNIVFCFLFETIT